MYMWLVESESMTWRTHIGGPAETLCDPRFQSLGKRLTHIQRLSFGVFSRLRHQNDREHEWRAVGHGQ